MRTIRKITAILAALVMLTGLTVCRAWADSALEVRVERAEGTYTVALVTGEEMNFGGLSGTISYDKGALSLKTCRSGALDPMVNADNGRFLADTGKDLTVPAGTVLLTLVFDTEAGYQEGKDYTFELKLDSVYNFRLSDYDWSKDAVLSAGTQGAAEAEDPVPEQNEDGSYTVTYTDEDGKVLFVDTVKPGEETLPPDLAGEWLLDGEVFDFEKIDGNVTLVLDPAPVPDPEPAPDPGTNAEEKASSGNWWLWLLLIPLALVIWLLFSRKKGSRSES